MVLGHGVDDMIIFKSRTLCLFIICTVMVTGCPRFAYIDAYNNTGSRIEVVMSGYSCTVSDGEFVSFKFTGNSFQNNLVDIHCPLQEERNFGTVAVLTEQNPGKPGVYMFDNRGNHMYGPRSPGFFGTRTHGCGGASATSWSCPVFGEGWKK